MMGLTVGVGSSSLVTVCNIVSNTEGILGAVKSMMAATIVRLDMFVFKERSEGIRFILVDEFAGGGVYNDGSDATRFMIQHENITTL